MAVTVRVAIESPTLGVTETRRLMAGTVSYDRTQAVRLTDGKSTAYSIESYAPLSITTDGYDF